jgi:uncharacterized protein YecT (DUF1311 family)
MTTLTFLLLMAATTGHPDDCLKLYHGIRVPPDLPAARRCFERSITPGCGGESPTLARAELAVMYLDAQGGPADPERAWDLLADCFVDITASMLQSTFEKRRPTGTFDFCKEIGGTTLTLNECGRVHLDQAAAQREAAAARLRAASSSGATAAIDAAEKAWTRLEEADAAVSADEVRDGTAATMFALGSRIDGETTRASWLTALAEGPRDAACDAKALGVLDQKLNEAYRAAQGRLPDDEARGLLRTAQRAWIASRDADAALAARAFGSGGATVTNAKCEATKVRIKVLEGVPAIR